MSMRGGLAGGGADIQAIALITKEIDKILAINDPPTDYGDAAKYRKDTEEVINAALDTTGDVQKYAGNINEKIDKLREALKKTTTKVQEAIMKALNSITYSENPRGQPVMLMTYVHEMMNLEVSKKRLEEALVQTQITVEKVQNNIILTQDDVDNLKGYLKSWQQAKKKNYMDEKREEEEERRRRKEEERRRREEEKRRREEEQERRRKEEEERKRREEEERRQREEEERQRKEEERRRREEEKRRREEEEERRRKEEEERKRREEEERRRLEEEEIRRKEDENRRREEEERLKMEEKERLKREEEEKKRKEEEEARLRRLEEEERRKQEERKRKEAERREKERQRREEEERRKRLDPNNWQSITYRRSSDELIGSRTHHNGICSILTAVAGSIVEDDVQCLASDEDCDLLPALADGEKILSSVITVDSKKGRLNPEAPLRLYVPHQPVPDAGDDLVAKIIVGEGDWTMTKTIPLPSRPLTDENIRLAGVELDNFETAKVVVVARPRCQNLIIDRAGTSQYSMYDKHVKLFAPRDAFKQPTEVKFSVKSIADDVRTSIEAGSDCIDSIITTGPIVSLACQKAPEKDLEVDLLRSSDALPSDKPIKGKTYQLVKLNKSGWQIADVEFKGRSKDVSITLPALKTYYSVMEVEVPQNTPREEVVRMASELYDCMNKSVVRMIVKQKEAHPEHVIVHCVRRECINERLNELRAIEYTMGPDTSREFYLFDGQKLRISCSGNIEPSLGNSDAAMLPFYAYMDTAKLEMVLRVRDIYKQRDLPEYVGNVHCQVMPLGWYPDSEAASGELRHELDIEIPVCLPKREHVPLKLKSVQVRFPHHWTALTVFLSWKLTGSELSDDSFDWFSVLCELGGGKRQMQTRRNQAKNKCLDTSDRSICRVMLEDWMKATNAHEDKLEPVMATLERQGLHALGKQCQEIVDFHREKMNDGALFELSETYSRSPRDLGTTLGLSEATLAKCLTENARSETLQVHAMLAEWRQSFGAIEKGTKAWDYLLTVMGK